MGANGNVPDKSHERLQHSRPAGLKLYLRELGEDKHFPL